MANNFTNIRSQLVAKMNGVGGLNGVYAYEVAVPTSGKYPFLTVTPQSFDAEFGDTVRNIRTYTFVLRLYQERTAVGFGNEKAERVVAEICDEILTAFDADTTLSGMVKYIKPVHGSLDYVEREIGDVRMAEFIIDCVTVVPSS